MFTSPKLLSILVIITLVTYFILIFYISRKLSTHSDNEAFFRANHSSPWWMVAFGMIGASISGVSFVSVPGWVKNTGMTYLIMCVGFAVGYVIVSFILLPLYYKHQLTSIYSYLGSRFGKHTHRSGAGFFLLSRIAGATARLYLAVLILHNFIAKPFGIPFSLTSSITLLLIWLYTRQSGIKTIVRTDALQTFCMLLAMIGIFWAVKSEMHYSLTDIVNIVKHSPYNYIWKEDGTQSFWRQFLSGIFIVIVMTGLDQDMMQKNLTCKNLKEAQKDMCSYGLCFIPVNFLLLLLGILLYSFSQHNGISLPTKSDELLPFLIANNFLGSLVILPFTIGIIAAAFSSADSALTSVTTSFCIDILNIEEKLYTYQQRENIRKITHLIMSILFLICLYIFKWINSGNIIDTIYTMASYSYGPLLGLYTMGLFTKRKLQDRWVPLACILGPVITAWIDHNSKTLFHYSFGYELLILNGLLTFLLLLFISKHYDKQEVPT